MDHRSFPVCWLNCAPQWVTSANVRRLRRPRYLLPSNVSMWHASVYATISPTDGKYCILTVSVSRTFAIASHPRYRPCFVHRTYISRALDSTKVCWGGRIETQKGELCATFAHMLIHVEDVFATTNLPWNWHVPVGNPYGQCEKRTNQNVPSKPVFTSPLPPHVLRHNMKGPPS